MEINTTLNIVSECVTNGNSSKVEKTETITSTSDTIELQCNYILNVIKQDEKSVTVLVQNGVRVYIRIILFDIESNMCLPCNCSKYLVTIEAKNNNDN